MLVGPVSIYCLLLELLIYFSFLDFLVLRSSNNLTYSFYEPEVDHSDNIVLANPERTRNVLILESCFFHILGYPIVVAARLRVFVRSQSACLQTIFACTSRSLARSQTNALITGYDSVGSRCQTVPLPPDMHGAECLLQLNAAELGFLGTTEVLANLRTRSYCPFNLLSRNKLNNVGDTVD
eukprot:g79128.t1